MAKGKQYKAMVNLTKVNEVNGRPVARERWCSVGTAFEVGGAGQINLVMDTLPIQQDQWNGVIVLFPAIEE